MTEHICHWPGCNQVVEPRFWGCRKHWAALPNRLRGWIWRTYRPGQEIDKRPSVEYLRAADAVQEWIKEQQEQARVLRESLGGQQ